MVHLLSLNSRSKSRWMCSSMATLHERDRCHLNRGALRLLLHLLALTIRVADASCAVTPAGDVQVYSTDPLCTWSGSFTAHSAIIAGSAKLTGAVRVASVEILSGGSLELMAGTGLVCDQLTVRAGGKVNINMVSTINVTGDAVFEAGSIVNGVGKGQPKGTGAGSCGSGIASCGAAHAGCGGSGGCNVSLLAGATDSGRRQAYGFFAAPDRPGSGSTDTAGGAAFLLTVNRSLTLNGNIDVSVSSTTLTGCGSGGSIFIRCGLLLPSNGSLTVDGGSTTTTSQSGSPGSAGRIAVVCAQHSFASGDLRDVTLRLSAAGGRTATAPVRYAGSGTIWLDLGVQAATDVASKPTLLVNAPVGAASAQPAMLMWPSTTRELNLTGAVVSLQNGAALKLVRDASVPSGSGRFVNASVQSIVCAGSGSSALQVDAGVSLTMLDSSDSSAAAGGSGGALQLSNMRVAFLSDSAAVVPYRTLLIGTNAAVVVNATTLSLASTSLVVDAGGNLTIADSRLDVAGLLVKSGGRMEASMVATVNVSGNALFEAGSVVDGFGRGFAAKTGPGFCRTGSCGGSAHAGCGAGGSCYSVALSGLPGSLYYMNYDAYGLYWAPDRPGSGGGTVPGGAALKLVASGTVSINGSIDMSAPSSVSAIGASGGSVFISCGTFAASTGRIAVDGGNSTASASGGSAGRIAIVSRSHGFRSASLDDVTLQLSAVGGGYGGLYGAPGTIWLDLGMQLSTGAASQPQLLVRGAGPLSAALSPPAQLMTVPTESRLINLTAAQLTLQAGATLRITRDFTSAGLLLNASVRSVTSDGSGCLQAGEGTSLQLLSNAGPEGSTFEIRNLSIAFLAKSNAVIDQQNVIIAPGGTLATEAVPLQLGAAAVVVQAGGTLSLSDAMLSCNDFSLQRGGRLLASFVATVNASGDASLEAGSIVDGVGRGYSQFYGPGATTSSSIGGGASHAGCGAGRDCNASIVDGYLPSSTQASLGVAYGLFSAPDRPGSGGSSGGGVAAGGGAAFQLFAAGAASLNGAVDVSAPSVQLYSGSGGSIHVRCGTLLPSNGTLAANGGDSALSPIGGGSAGRIAVVSKRHYMPSASAADVPLSISAVGGKSRAVAGPANYGAPGTVWLDLGTHVPSGLQSPPLLVVRAASSAVASSTQPALLMWPARSRFANRMLPQWDGLGGADAASSFSAYLDFKSDAVQVLLLSGASLRLVRDSSALPTQLINASLAMPSGDGSGTLQADFGVQLELSSAVTAVGSAPLTNFSAAERVLDIRNASLVFLPGSVPILPAAAIIVGNRVTLAANGTTLRPGTASAPADVLVQPGGSVSLASAALHCATIRLQRGSRLIASMAAVFNVSGDAVLESGSVVDGGGRGYAASQGPGYCSSGKGGASHAGCGAGCTCVPPVMTINPSARLSNASYGSFAAPLYPGSGGVGGAGGAAFQLQVGGALTLNASVNVNASAGGAATYGGSGGSIFVSCGILTASSGSLSAHGGAGSIHGGAAGRIAITCDRHPFRSADIGHVTVQSTAVGGRSGSSSTYGSPGTIWLNLTRSSLPNANMLSLSLGQDSPFHRIRMLLIRGASSATPAVLPAVAMGAGLLQLDRIRLDSGAALQFAPASPTDAAGFAVSSLTSAPQPDGSSQLSVLSNATLQLSRQRVLTAVTAGGNSSRSVLLPANVTVAAGADSVAATLSPATVLSCAQVVFTEPGCATLDTCETYRATLRVQGSDMYHACAAGSLAQSWTAARLLSIVSCGDSTIEAVFDFQADPGPWLFYAANISLLVPAIEGNAAVSSNAVPVQLPDGPSLTITGPAAANWSDTVTLAGNMLGCVLQLPGTRLIAESNGVSVPIIVQAPRLSAFGGSPSSNHTANVTLRFVASAWQLEVSDGDAAAPAAWLVRIVMLTPRQPGRADAGAVIQTRLLSNVQVPVVRARKAVLPPLLARAGYLLPAGSVELPAPPWTAAEAAQVCPADECSVSVGPFTTSFAAAGLPCPGMGAGGAATVLARLPVPAGFGSGYAVTLSLCGGLLNISLGRASYEPSGILGVWPPALNLPQPSAAPSITFHWMLAAADDADFYERFSIGGAFCSDVQQFHDWQPPAEAPSAVQLASVHAATVLNCSVATADLAAAVPDDLGASSLSAAVTWDAALVPLGASITVVERPLLSRLKPAVLTPGGVCVIDGSHFCKGDPNGACFAGSIASGGFGAATAGGAPPVEVWLESVPGASGVDAAAPEPLRVPCANLQVLTDDVATCVPPPLSPALPGYPRFIATLTNNAGANATARLNATYPSSSGYVRAAAAAQPLATRFVPSDATALWLLPDAVVVEVVLAASSRVLSARLRCTIAPRTPGVLLLPEQDGRSLTDVAGSSSVSFGRIGIQAPFAQASVTLTISCTAPEDSEVTTLTPLEWTLQPHALALMLCDPLPLVVDSLQTFPAFRVAVALAPAVASSSAMAPPASLAAQMLLSASGSSNAFAAECASNGSFTAFPLPPITCAVSAAVAPSSTTAATAIPAVLQGNFAEADQSSGVAVFSSLSIGGATGID